MVTIHRVEGYCTNQVAEQTRNRFLLFSPFDGCDPSQRRDHYDAARVAAGRGACKQERAVVSPSPRANPFGGTGAGSARTCAGSAAGIARSWVARVVTT